ncbi:glycosyltransferase family 2 protein [Candidatus Woesearchaeota archaeon]|nr:glycosyltransferase family 2 protein [Candidatus Woesearchaeota archaeon]
MVKISIIIPVYNEEASVYSVINKIKEVTDDNFEIIVVDDHSKDRSKEYLEAIKGIRIISHPVNKGYGASLKTGINASKGEYLLITDSDGTYPVEDIPKLVKFIPKYDMVVGARVGRKVKIPLLRKPAKWFLKHFSSYIASYKIPDLNSGLRIFKKKIVLDHWNLFPEKFSFTSTLTMLCHTKGYNVKYIPINYYKRKGKSTIHPIKDFIGFTKLLMKLSLFFNPLQIFIPCAILLFLSGCFILLLGLTLFNRFYDTTFIMISLSAVQIFFFGLIAELVIRKK